MNRNKLKLLLLVAAVAGLFAIGRIVPIGAYVDELRGWIAGLGNAGPVAFVLVYIAATILALPGTPLTVLAGALFGGFWGTVYISIASTVGAAAAFLIARYIARNAVQQWLEGKPQFERLEQLTARRAALVVAITRLVPLFPFNLLNYGFGLTNVPFGTYVLWSWICMLPGTILYVVGVDVLVGAVQHGEISPSTLAVVVVVFLILVGFGRVARTKLGDLDKESINEHA